MMNMNKENKKNAGKMNVMCAVLWGFAEVMNALAGQWGLAILNVFLRGMYLCQIEKETKAKVESLA